MSISTLFGLLPFRPVALATTPPRHSLPGPGPLGAMPCALPTGFLLAQPILVAYDPIYTWPPHNPTNRTILV